MVLQLSDSDDADADARCTSRSVHASLAAWNSLGGDDDEADKGTEGCKVRAASAAASEELGSTRICDKVGFEGLKRRRWRERAH